MRRSLTLEEKLVLLAEEAAEVIQAATKCHRFGFSHYEPGYGKNDEELAKEVGQLLGVVESLDLDWDIIEQERRWKMHIAQGVLHKYAVNPDNGEVE